MSKLKKRWMRQSILAMSTVIVTGSILCGCSRQEMTRTISLPDIEDEGKGISGIVIKNIQEYTYGGHSEDNLRLAWGKTGSNTAIQLRYEEEGYVYRKIDINTKETISKEFMDDRMVSNIQIAPGGRYVSYEAEPAKKASPELVVFLAEEGEHIVLREWNESLQFFSYIWSDDGTKLFSWQDGDNYAFSPDTDWCVTCYDMETVKQDSNGGRSIEKKEFRMEGNGHAWRHVLPNADGTKVYVREEYESFSDSKEKEYSENQEIKKKKAAKNWLIMPEKQEIKKLQEYADEPVNPVKYTKKGLYFQKEGKLLLVENPEDTPSVKELFRVAGMEVNICGNGEHIFLIEWMDDLQSMQLSGVKLEGTEPTAKQALYKASFEGGDCISADDSAIVLQGYEYLENDRCNFKVMELGY